MRKDVVDGRCDRDLAFQLTVGAKRLATELVRPQAAPASMSYGSDDGSLRAVDGRALVRHGRTTAFGPSTVDWSIGSIRSGIGRPAAWQSSSRRNCLSSLLM